MALQRSSNISTAKHWVFIPDREIWAVQQLSSTIIKPCFCLDEMVKEAIIHVN